MPIESGRLPRYSLLVLLVGCAVYASVLTTGHFLSLLPRHRADSAWLILVGLACSVVLSGWRSSPAVPDDAARFTVRQFALLVLSFCLVALALYAGSLSLGLLSDDFPLLERAVKHQFIIRSWYLRPLPLVLWAWIKSVGGADWSLHALNVFLHGVNAALVAALARRLGLSMLASICAGAVFICFPASVEAVAWASGVQDVLLTTFCLAFVLACGFSERPDLVVPLSMLALGGALACKETAIVAPVLGCVVWFGTKDRWRLSPIACGLVLVGGYVVLRALAFDQASVSVTPSRFLVKEALCRTFSELAVPFTGQELLRFPVIGILTGVLFAALLLAAVRKGSGDRRFATLVARSGMWALASAVPLWLGFGISTALQGSRYLYLPACGWSILVALLLVERRTRTGRALGLLVTGVLLFVWLLGGRSHLRDWQEAAELRDRVLASAITHLQDTPCTVLTFSRVPDSVRGAYVFRNGFVEALQGRATFRAKATIVDTGDARCTLGWRDGAFR